MKYKTKCGLKKCRNKTIIGHYYCTKCENGMSKTIQFQMIADSRDYRDIGNEIERLDYAVKRQAKRHNLEITCSNTRLVNFGDIQQYRIDYAVQKQSGQTYQNIYAIINAVKPVPYKLTN